ncbi:hypothetical protein XENORESO_008110, partial [Xenotaenia resolanae]
VFEVFTEDTAAQFSESYIYLLRPAEPVKISLFVCYAMAPHLLAVLLIVEFSVLYIH